MNNRGGEKELKLTVLLGRWYTELFQQVTYPS